MYKNDLPKIKKFVLEEGISGMDRVFYFMLGSIRVKFLTLPSVTDSIVKEGALSRHIWGNKATAYKDYNRLDKIKLFEDVFDPAKSTIDLSRELTDIRGIGVTKSSFFLQLLGRDTACLDVHNLKKLGFHHKKFAKKDIETAKQYHKTVNEKGAAFWWDSWCGTIFDGYSEYFESPEQISNLHLEIISGQVTDNFKKV